MSDGRLPARRRWIRWVVGVIVTLLLLSIGWVVIRGIGAVNELQQVAKTASQLRNAVSEGDLVEAEQVAPRIAHHAAAAHDLTDDAIWRGFEFVPWLGPNFTAVREVADIADSIATDAITPVLKVASTMDLAGFGFNGTTIDLAPFAEVEAPLAAASTALSTAESRAVQIDAGATLEPLGDAVRKMRDTVTEAATVVGALHGASVLLPSMLGGGDTPRTYVLAMQNNAELRSQGGIVGSLALLQAHNGTISIIRQSGTPDFPALDVPLPLSESTIALFEDGPGRYVQNATSIPEFPEAAATIAARWLERYGETVDGVIAVDAVVAQHLLTVTGPLTFGPFTAEPDTVLSILLSEIYAAIPDPLAQDAVFAQAAGALFSAALNKGEPRQLIGALADATGEGRVHVWSAHEEEQKLLAETALGGTIPKDDADGVHVGVLLNDTTGGKMDYYATAAFSTAIGTCNGKPTTQVRVTWTNTAPADAATSLPTYVTADGFYGVPAGSISTLIAVYGPEGATLNGYDRDGAEEAVQTTTFATRSVIQHDVLLAPGESTTITVDFVGNGAGERLTELQHTPMSTDPKTTRDTLVCR